MAICLFPMGDFLQNPPSGFSISRRTPTSPSVGRAFDVNVDAEQAVFVSPSTYTTQLVKIDLQFVGNTNHTIQIADEIKWNEMKRAILSRPLYVTCKCKVQTDEQEHYRTITRIYTVADYIARLETQSEPIQQQLEGVFDRALQHIRKGEKYTIKVDLSHAIGDWFEAHQGQVYCTGSRTFEKAYFTLTNGSVALYDGCVYSCYEDPGACACSYILCFPCCLLCCFPYFLCRKCQYKDSKHQIVGEVRMIEEAIPEMQQVDHGAGGMMPYGVPVPAASPREMEYPLVYSES